MDLYEMKLQDLHKKIVMMNLFCELIDEGRLYQ